MEWPVTHKELFKADFFIASDGPRLQPDTPTVFMGSRGVCNFTMTLNLRDGGHHSVTGAGFSNPGVIMAYALASIVDAKGRILVDAWKPDPMPNSCARRSPS